MPTFYFISTYISCALLSTLVTLFSLVSQSSLAIQIGRAVAHSFTTEPRDMTLSKRPSVVAKSWQSPVMNSKPGKKLSYFPHLQVASMVTSLLVLQKKTD